MAAPRSVQPRRDPSPAGDGRAEEIADGAGPSARSGTSCAKPGRGCGPNRETRALLSGLRDRSSRAYRARARTRSPRATPAERSNWAPASDASPSGSTGEENSACAGAANGRGRREREAPDRRRSTPPDSARSVRASSTLRRLCLPRGARMGKVSADDYPALAGLAGYGRGDYERLDSRHQREARARIDRELAMRRELGRGAGEAASTGRPDRGRELEGTLGEGVRSAGERARVDPPPGQPSLPVAQRGRDTPSASHPRPRHTGSPVLDDAREVAARRKRQLGRDRP